MSAHTCMYSAQGEVSCAELPTATVPEPSNRTAKRDGKVPATETFVAAQAAPAPLPKYAATADHLWLDAKFPLAMSEVNETHAPWVRDN